MTGIEVLPPSAPFQATQAALEAETNEDTYAPPDLIKHSLGVAKAWCHITAAGALSSPNYNVASITDEGIGRRIVVWAVDFSGAVYTVVADILQESNLTTRSDTLAVGQVEHKIITVDTPAFADSITSIVAFGDQ